jgi:hypothetical protein
MPRPPPRTRARQISIAVESRFHVSVRLPAIGSVASTARSDLRRVAEAMAGALIARDANASDRAVRGFSNVEAIVRASSAVADSSS